MLKEILYVKNSKKYIFALEHNNEIIAKEISGGLKIKYLGIFTPFINAIAIIKAVDEENICVKITANIGLKLLLFSMLLFSASISTVSILFDKSPVLVCSVLLGMFLFSFIFSIIFIRFAGKEILIFLKHLSENHNH